MARIVMKFGGTSVAGLDRIRNAAGRVKAEVDRGNQVARSYGVAHRFGDSLREILAYAGTDLSEHNGDDSFVLPIPAVYVVDRRRRIRLAYVFGSYIDRLEPDELLAALRGLGEQE